jgi:glycerol-3-phosphate O-acyltransferase / dihydroxyacetone phosphate acyltransferase
VPRRPRRVTTEGPASPGVLYRCLRAAVRAALGVFYGTIEATGLDSLDANVPTVLACNHPNSIVDPLLLGLFEKRQIAFCARDGLFKIPVFGSVLRSAGAIPIRRRAEHAGAMDNADAFSAARAVLERGGVMAIFPEGKTHGSLRIEPLKTGAARIALGTNLAASTTGLRIVPVGVTYLVRHAFRSDVHVAFGKPIIVTKGLLPHAQIDHPDNVRALTEKIGDAIRALAVHIEKSEDERLIAQVTSIIVGIRAEEGLDEGGQSPAERTALVRRVVDAYRWIDVGEPARAAELRQRIDRFIEEREDLGLGGERPALQHRGEEQRRLNGAARVAFLIGGAPLAAFGLVTSLPPYVALRVLMRLLPVSTDRIALFKLVGGAILFAGAYAAEVAMGVHYLGAILATFLGSALVPAALFARRYSIEARLHRLHLGTFNAWRRHSTRLEALRAERRALAEELSVLRRIYLESLGGAP